MRNAVEALAGVNAAEVTYLREAGWVPEVYPRIRQLSPKVLFADPIDGELFELDAAVQIQKGRDFNEQRQVTWGQVT